MGKIETDQLAGISETMLIPVWAKAMETRGPAPIIRDAKAVEIVERVRYDFSKFGKAWKSQVGVSVRTMLLDRAVAAFLLKHGDAVVVNLGAGLDTRLDRLSPDRIGAWYDLDLPESIAFRRNFFEENDRVRFIAKSVFDDSWMEDVEESGAPVLIVCEGTLMYFDGEDVKTLFRKMATRFPGAEILFDSLPTVFVGRGRRHDSVNRVKGGAEFRWGLDDPQSLLEWDSRLRLLDQWHYFDFYRDRWRILGRLALIPAFRRIFANRIVHLRVDVTPEKSTNENDYSKQGCSRHTRDHGSSCTCRRALRPGSSGGAIPKNGLCCGAAECR
jgi:O-methyltransferase involved in polyketide biosynthesis